MDYEQWMQRAQNAIDSKIEPGKEFEVKHLFHGCEWESLSRGEKISFGKYFSSAVKEGRLANVTRCGEGKITILYTK